MHTLCIALTPTQREPQVQQRDFGRRHLHLRVSQKVWDAYYLTNPVHATQSDELAFMTELVTATLTFIRTSMHFTIVLIATLSIPLSRYKSWLICNFASAFVILFCCYDGRCMADLRFVG